MQTHQVLENVSALSKAFGRTREERQKRNSLHGEDFKALSDTGFPLLAVPKSAGGCWEDIANTSTTICQALRSLAQGDSSVALVSAMHPAVLSYWLVLQSNDHESREWIDQCESIFDHVKQGQLFGTITSEPGSGGDVHKTRTRAVPTNQPLEYRLSGQKHFGSGSGVLSFMVTTAVPQGESQPDWFFIDMRGRAWDGSAGMKLISEWDAHGMTATQSHAMAFEELPATRIAQTDQLAEIAKATGPFIGCLFTSVIVGILDIAFTTAEEKLTSTDVGAYEEVEWTRIELDYWLVQQAFVGMLSALRESADPRRDILLAKTAIAELAEQMMTRICRVMGGSSFSRHSPFGHWFEDVRALGFLRPPWNLAFSTLIASRHET